MGSDGEDARDEIMDAVFMAICDKGYSDLTIQDIADEVGKSTSLIHYHYDTKEDLMEAFFDEVVGDMGSVFDDLEGEDPTERLQRAVEIILFEMDDADGKNFHRALVELRSVAPYRSGYPERFKEIESTIREELEAIIRDGVATGDFDVEDPAIAADLVYEVFHGHIIEKVTSRFDEPVRDGRVERYIDMILK